MQPFLQWKTDNYNIFRVFVALGIQPALRMRHISSVAYSAVQYFSTLSHERHDFREKSY